MLTQEYVDAKFKESLETGDFTTIVELLRAAEKGHAPLMNLPEDTPEMDINIDWDALEKIALEPTPREKIEHWIKSLWFFQKLKPYRRLTLVLNLLIIFAILVLQIFIFYIFVIKQ